MLLTSLSLAKPKILILVAITALASAIVANQGDILFSMGVLLVLAVVLASAGAALLNNYLDKDIDIIMERTRNRPLPNGKFSPPKVFLAGITLIVLSVLPALALD